MNSVTGQPNLSLDSIDCTDKLSIDETEIQTPSPHADRQINVEALIL